MFTKKRNMPTVLDPISIAPPLPSDAELYSALKNLAKHRSDFIFDLDGSKNIAMFMSAIYENSNELFIYATDMNGDISDNEYYFESFKKYINNYNRLYIILDTNVFDEEDNKSKVLQFARKEICSGNKSIEFGILPPTTKKEFQKTLNLILKEIIDTSINTDIHFAVSNNNSIRIETDPKSHYSPICSFNYENIANLLIEEFKSIFKKCINPFEDTE